MFNLRICNSNRHTGTSDQRPKRSVAGRALVVSALAVTLGTVSIAASAPVFAQSPASVDVMDSLYGTSNSAIRDLLRNSRRQIAKNEFEAAGITLERALAIQSDNPVLWNALARLRYRQGGYREVQSLTMRSESLAGNNRELILRNRQLAAAAQTAMTGEVTAIADLDLQTPSEATLATGTTSTGSNAGGTNTSAAGSGRLAQQQVLKYESLPAPSAATGQVQPRVTHSQPSQPTVSTPSPSGYVTGGTIPNTVEPRTDRRQVVVAPASPTPAQPQWNNQAVVVTPPPVSADTPARPAWNNQQVVTPTPQPGLNTQRSDNHQVITRTPSGTSAGASQTVVSSNGIEERSFSHYGKGGRGVPRQYLPPPGLCRLWFDGRVASAQPAPAQCAVLRRNVPAGARLIVGEHRYSWDPFTKRY